MRRGLSLIEVVLATALLGGMVLAIIGLLPVSLRALLQAKDLVSANAIAEHHLEDLRMNAFTATDEAHDESSFHVERRVRPSPNSPNVRIIEVDVTWRNHAVRLHSRVFKKVQP